MLEFSTGGGFYTKPFEALLNIDRILTTLWAVDRMGFDHQNGDKNGRSIYV